MTRYYWTDIPAMDCMTEEQELESFDILDNLTDNTENVKREFNRKWMLAKKYGMDEYADELVRLIEKIDYYRKA